MAHTPRDSGKLDVLTKRVGILGRLADGAAHKRDLVEELDQSRSTINRAIDELRAVDLVERRDDGFAATTAGRLALERLETFRSDLDDIVAAEAVVDSLPVEAPVSNAVVAGSRAVPATDPAPYRPLEGFHADLADADRYRALLPALDDPRHVRLLYEHVVTGGRPAELVVAPEVFDTLRREFPRRLAAMAETDGFDLLVGEVPPFALAIVGSGEPAAGEPPDDRGTTVYVVAFSEGGAVGGTLVNGSASAVRWAEERYAEAAAGAEKRSETVVADADGGAVAVDADGGAARGVPGGRLSVPLEREGFVRLGVEYFADEPVVDPTTAWRAGLTLPEVHAGYAVERTLADGETGGDADPEGSPRGMTESVVSDLAAGTDCVVVGPPGSGKSTVCKRVACEWYDADRGAVLYREGGRGRPFESVDDLVATVDLAEGHALVVVEDAVRPDADAVFEAIDRLADREDASVLLDARESEWRDPPGDPPDAPGVAVETMPPLTDADVERVVEHFERTVGETVSVPVERLGEEVREAAAGDGAAPGEVLLLLHRLATYADPLAEGPTSLESAVAGLYGDLAGDELALDVCVLANALNAAGIEVAPDALYAVAGDGGGDGGFDAVDRAIERLEGRVLFDRDGDDGGAYRTVHESWSVAFLAHLLDAEGEGIAAERVGDCLTAYLGLADDPGRRDRIARHRGGELSLTGIVDDPGGWADAAAESLYALARDRPKLAPLLFDERDTVALPAACSEAVAERVPAWLGRAFLDAGAFDRAERAFQRLPDDGSARAVYRRIGLAKVGDDRGEYDDAVAHAEAALDLAEELDDERLRARAERTLGWTLAGAGEYDEAEPHLRRALDRFETLGDRRRVAGTLDHLGVVERRRTEYDAAREYHRRSLDLARELGDRRGAGRSHNNLGSVAKNRNDYAAARDHYERSLEIHRQLGDRAAVGSILDNLGLVARHQGEYDDAREYHRRGLSVNEAVGDRHGQAQSLGNLGLLAKNRGDHEAAIDYYERSMEIHRDLGLRHGEAKVCVNVAEVAVQQGDVETAREYGERGAAVFEEIGDKKGLAVLANVLGAADREDGDHDGAAERFRRSVELFRAVDTPHGAAVARRNLGEVLAAGDDTDGAREHWREALETFEEVGAPQDALETLRHLVGTCREVGDDGDAERYCERARGILAEAPGPVADEHREWVDREAAALGAD